MARLTPLSKGLIGLAVIGAMASAVWNFALKDGFGPAAPPPAATSTAATSTAPTSTSPTVTGLITSDPRRPEAPARPVISAPPNAPPAPSPAPVAASKPPAVGLSPAEHAARGRQLLASSDFAQARQHLEQAVQGGDAGAACHLGEMTLKGQGGLKADQDAAAKLFQLAQSRNSICFAPGQ